MLNILLAVITAALWIGAYGWFHYPDLKGFYVRWRERREQRRELRRSS